MAEPARRYDPDIEPEIRPNLHVVQGGGESTSGRGDLHSVDDTDTANDLADQEKRFGVIQGGGESTPGRASLSAVKDQEETAPGAGWANNYSGTKQQPKLPFGKRMLQGLQKKGPLGMILGIVLGGGGGVALLFSPSLGIVQLKEILTGDLNDSLGATTSRVDKNLDAKLKSFQNGFSLCTNAVSIRCKFATFSKRQVQQFKDKGFKVEPEDSNKFFGRTKPTKITFPSGKVATNPTELRNIVTNDVADRSAFRRATMNPLFGALSDKLSATVFARFRTDKSSKVDGKDDKERDQNMDSETAGEATGVNDKGYLTDSDGRNYVLDENGNKVYESGDGSNPDKFKSISESNASKIKSGLGAEVDKAKVDGGVTGGVLKGGLKGASVLGALDTACTVYNTSRAIAAAAKVARALQLAQFAMVFLTTADQIKAGTATPEQVSYVGNKLAAVDTNKQVVDEGSTWSGTGTENATAAAHDNPNYGKNAFDSNGYKTAAYNEAPKLSSRDLQYTVGGGLAGTLSGVLDAIANTLGGRKNIKSTCGVVQSWWARSAGLVAGVVSAVGSFGVSTVISIGASVAIGFAMPYLQAALADIIAGKVVGSSTSGVDAGDAAFSGTSSILGGNAMAHGMIPASKDDLKGYMAINNEAKQQDIAMETYDARSTPFDISNQYSFLGSAVRQINPALLKSTASVSAALTNIPTILSTAFSSIIPHVSADQQFNADRFSKCNDDGYAELGIDADVFCNVRYYMSPEQLSWDPDDVAVWMIDHGHIDEQGNPVSDDYKNWITNCTQREDGWGESSNSDNNNDDWATGKNCVQKNDEIQHFSVFWMDSSIQDSLDNGPTTGASAAGAQTSAATPEMCKTLPADDLGQIACKAYQFDNYGYLWAGGHSGTAKGFMDNFRAGKWTAGKDAILDCSGLVRMSIYDATGVDIGGLSTGDYPSYSKFKEVNKADAKAGDIIWTSEHTEVIVSNDPSKKIVQTFGAHTAGIAFKDQIGPSSYAYGAFDKVYRFQK